MVLVDDPLPISRAKRLPKGLEDIVGREEEKGEAESQGGREEGGRSVTCLAPSSRTVYLVFNSSTSLSGRKIQNESLYFLNG